MMTDFFIWYMVFNKLGVIFITATVILAIWCCALIILWALNAAYPKDEEKLEQAKKMLFKIAIPIFSIFLLISIMLPSKKEMILYATLKSADTYNANNKNSMVNPEGVLKVVDKTLQKIDGFLDGRKAKE